MRLWQILTISAPALALMGCDDYATTGLRADPLPPSVSQDCLAPGQLVGGVTVADDFVSMRRLGDALIECDEARAIAVSAYTKLKEAISAE